MFTPSAIAYRMASGVIVAVSVGKGRIVALAVSARVAGAVVATLLGRAMLLLAKQGICLENFSK